MDNTLTFDYHISEICKKTGKKVNALARVSQYMNLSERKILISAFSDSQFRYHWYECVTVALIIRSKGLFITINSHHLRSYLKRITFSINDRSAQILFTEMYNKVVTNNFSSPHMNEIFTVNNEDPYNVTQTSQFFRT